MLKVGIIGCGYWGPNYTRILNDLTDVEIGWCCDLDKERLAKIKELYPYVKLSDNYKELVKNPEINAFIVTTPLNSHYEIVKLCLENGKHVLVEKPFTSTSKEAKELIKIMDKRNLILMVGHVYEFNPAVTKLKEVIKEGKLGDIYYVYAERVGLGPIRKYASALWDLATHDMSVATYILDEFPESVTAVGEYYIQKKVEDMVSVSLRFPSRVIYKIIASWIAPEKIRRTTVVGSKGMAIFDDVNKAEPLKIYERSINKDLLDSTPEYSDHQLVVKMGDVYLPKVVHSESLKNQVEHFLKCILENKKPLTDAIDGLSVVKMLEAAERSLKINRTVKCR
ncbi:MAG: Gfo/Idh/MocA family oxidoreductase [Candidatus Omnitrophica bacterium]|nr:Gfo/Idh/MocA family oxidoreductase [Candidatus Omnitrophota bacterium]